MKIALNINSLRSFQKNFYKKIVDFPQTSIPQTNYNHLQDLLIQNRTTEHFQALCDVIYYDKLMSMPETTFFGKVVSKIKVNVSDAATLLDRMETKRPKNYTTNSDVEILIEDKLKGWREYIQKFHFKNNEIITKLVFNLLFELLFIGEISEEKTAKINTLDELLDFLCNYAESNEFENKKYYLNAVEEIKAFRTIISKTLSKDNDIPITDMAYEKWWVIDYENIDLYKDFMEFIKKCAFAETSFILKYILISNLKMSSGERAFQNFFSWINVLDFLNKIDKNVLDSTKKNVLLLIDEIDLYCHPEWQRKFLQYLIEEINNQFIGKKVQIIFATHSPIVLSDMPDSNVVYLEDGNVATKKTKTFAQNIYTLFCDAFYLSGTIGEFARIRINAIIKSINSIRKGTGETSKKVRDLRNQINIVGETLIRNKLHNMLDMKIISTVDKNSKIALIEKKIKRLIEEKEALNNDTNQT